jgi:hypothetical protein
MAAASGSLHLLIARHRQNEEQVLMPKGDSFLLIGVAIFGLVGLLSLYAAWRMVANTRAFQRTAAHAAGMVTALKEESSRNKDGATSHAFYPTIEFPLPDGKNVSFTADTAVNEHEFPVGESIKVLYDPANPHQARIDSFDSLGAGPITLGIFGAAFLAGALLIYFLLYREIEIDTPLFVAAGFAGATCLLAWGAWHFGRESFDLRAHGIRTEGTVLNADAGPLIEYVTREGRTRQFQSHIASNPPKYAVGDKVPMIYSPEKSSLVKIDSFSDLWLVPGLFSTFGLLSLFAVILALYTKLHTR